jgi:O-methyltransferase
MENTQNEAAVIAGKPDLFPFDLMMHRDFPGVMGENVRRVAEHSLQPPHPWGNWLYGNILPGFLGSTEGDLVEMGVGLGGMSVFLGMLAREHGKRVFSLDSFEGLPAPDPERDSPYFLEGFYKGADESLPLLARFQEAVEKFDLSSVVKPVPGFFDQVDPAVLPEKLCFAHLDSDLYSSVSDSLELVWPRLVPGGVVVVDDFFHPAQGPARALADFFNRRSEIPVLHVVFPYSVAFVKGETPDSAHMRAHDGNVYSLDFLRADTHFRDVLREAVTTSDGSPSDHPRTRLLRVLDSAAKPEDIYEYWAALGTFWTHLDYRPSAKDTLDL